MLGAEKEQRSEPPNVGCYVSELKLREQKAQHPWTRHRSPKAVKAAASSSGATSTLPFLIPFHSLLRVLTKLGMFSSCRHSYV